MNQSVGSSVSVNDRKMFHLHIFTFNLSPSNVNLRKYDHFGLNNIVRTGSKVAICIYVIHIYI